MLCILATCLFCFLRIARFYLLREHGPHQVVLTRYLTYWYWEIIVIELCAMEMFECLYDSSCLKVVPLAPLVKMVFSLLISWVAYLLNCVSFLQSWMKVCLGLFLVRCSFHWGYFSTIYHYTLQAKGFLFVNPL